MVNEFKIIWAVRIFKNPKIYIDVLVSAPDFERYFVLSGASMSRNSVSVSPSHIISTTSDIASSMMAARSYPSSSAYHTYAVRGVRTDPPSSLTRAFLTTAKVFITRRIVTARFNSELSLRVSSLYCPLVDAAQGRQSTGYSRRSLLSTSCKSLSKLVDITSCTEKIDYRLFLEPDQE
uniref:Uncharacterized protein n=1 Tax=Glossina pallidipes TaxID=7398 RepID=A0A1A9ZV02_GLOPL